MHSRRLPALHVQVFVVCRQITHDPQTGEIVIVGPTSHVPVDEFPATIRVAVYGHVTGCHGTYPICFQLRAADGDVVWQWRPPTPMRMADPLALTQLVFTQLSPTVPAAGRYDLVLMTGEDDIGHQPLFVGPPDMVERHRP